jgi:hypothetical protein
MIKSDFSDIERLMGFLDEMKHVVNANEEQAVLAAGNAYAADVQKFPPPVDTGHYRNSIRAELARGDGVHAVVGSPMPQTRRLEFGFKGMDSKNRFYNQAQRPHWRPAWYPNLQKYIAIMNKILLRDVHMK